jgi:ethanolamine permease
LPSLKKEINTLHLWAIAVGLVISGEYFGWNYGWAASGTIGFLISTLIVSILYITFIFSYTELTAIFPDAGGPFTYARQAMGDWWGFIAGFATLVDFLLAPPAIAFALGSYAHFLIPQLPVVPVAIAMYVVFIIVNLLGIGEAARFSLIVTLLAVGEIVLYLVLILPAFKLQNFTAHNPQQTGLGEVFAGLPYAVWFFVAIEGVAMVAEEVRNPQKTIPKGYILSILTLVILALGIMILSGGVGDWRLLSEIDHPLPETLGMVFGKESGWAKVFTSLGLFGLISSFHSNTIGYSRQIFALAREGFLPSRLARLNRFHTPYMALIGGGIIGFLIIGVMTWLNGKTDEIIILSVLGAIVMYITSMISLLVLRKKQPNLPRPFLTPFYPVFPWIAILLCLLCVVAIIWYHWAVSLIFFGMMAISAFLFSFRLRNSSKK